jgi:site-specific recombinase XerD
MVDRKLESLTPDDAIEWYLKDRQDDLRPATLRSHRSALNIFQDWTREAGISNLNDLAGRDLARFKTWRKNETDINRVSLNGTLGILQCFLRFCETIEAVEDGLAEKVQLPNVPEDEEVRTEVPDDEAVQAIRDYCRRFEYATRRHAEFELIAEIGIRLGTIRAIDLEDVQAEAAVIELRHRPESSDTYGTPLKNGSDGERIVNISPDLVDLLEDYIFQNRQEVVDRFDREPLFTTGEGRVSTATVRRDFYKLTRPCEYEPDCPHGREIAACEATRSGKAGSCPSSFSTHPLRKWAIMSQLDSGVPKEILSDRVDVSVPVLEKHYDQRSEERKSRRRREELSANLPQYAMTDGGRDTHETDE